SPPGAGQVITVGWAGRILAGSGLVAAAAVIVPAAAPGAAAASEALTATTTTLTASATPISRNSWVTFTATVSGASTGSVTFTDVSNGSVLDTAPVSSGTATFATAALAAGSRRIVASYGASGTSDASTSAAVGISVASTGSRATAYQIDPRHN